MNIRQLLLPATVCAMLLVSPALADQGGNPNVNASEGLVNAVAGLANQLAKCLDIIGRQTAMGVTGAETGSENDPKLFPTAVTNCDQFWTQP
jgi:hypothetical protein